MIPYDGTPIKDQLARTGRLRGDICNRDYDFLDERLSDYYQALSRLVHVTGWIHGYHALSPQLHWAWHETAVMERLFPPLPGMEDYKNTLAAITRDSNDLLLRVVEDLSYVFSDGAERVASGMAAERVRAFHRRASSRAERICGEAPDGADGSAGGGCDGRGGLRLRRLA